MGKHNGKNKKYSFYYTVYPVAVIEFARLWSRWYGNICFRQYSDEDIEKGALWANFGYIPDTEKEVMCLESDGTLIQVGTDYGHGTMFIADGRLYSQRYINRKNSVGDDFYGSVVYSCELDGSIPIPPASVMYC